MSRRRLEHGASVSSSFSLRTITTAPAAGHAGGAAPRRAHPGPAPPPTVSAAPALNFRFNSLGSRPVEAPAKPAEPPKLNNFFAKPVGAGGGKEAGDVLRLSAVVDDLTQRLRKTTEVKAQLEGQMQRINAVLLQERQNATARIQSLKNEVSAVQESEGRLRSELAVRPAVKEVHANKFQSSVRSALEQEEANARVADAEARVAQLARRSEALGAEVRLLEERKGAGLAGSAVSSEEVEALVARAAEAQAKLSEIEDLHAVVEDSIVHLEAVRDARREESVAADAKLFKANEATATAVADAAAAKAQVKELMLEHGSVAGKVVGMKEKLAGMHLAVDTPRTETSGAAAPVGMLGKIGASPQQVVDALSCCGGGVGFHFAYDCPTGVTGVHVPASVGLGEPSPDGMVNAIVSDLKAHWQNAADTHAALGSALAAMPAAVDAQS